jgi:hypothetical protein
MTMQQYKITLSSLVFVFRIRIVCVFVVTSVRHTCATLQLYAMLLSIMEASVGGRSVIEEYSDRFCRWVGPKKKNV